MRRYFYLFLISLFVGFMSLCASAQTSGRVHLQIGTGLEHNLLDAKKPKIFVTLTNGLTRDFTDAALVVKGVNWKGETVFAVDEKVSLASAEEKTVSWPIRAKIGVTFVSAKLRVRGIERPIVAYASAILPAAAPKGKTGVGFADSTPGGDAAKEGALMKRLGAQFSDLTGTGFMGLRHVSLDLLPEESEDAFAARAKKEFLEAYAENVRIYLFGMTLKEESQVETFIRRMKIFSALRKEVKKKCVFLLTPSNFRGQITEKGGKELFDGTSDRRYSNGRTTDDWLLWDLRWLREGLEKRGTPLRYMEINAYSTHEKTHAPNLRQGAECLFLALAMLKAEKIPLIGITRLQGGEGNPQHERKKDHMHAAYGFLDANGAARPVLATLPATLRILEGATHARYHLMPNKLQALTFETPKGPLAFLYWRGDGVWMNLSFKQPRPEPHEDTWPSRQEFTFRAVSKTVRIVYPDGSEETLPAKNGKITLTLTGAPIAVFGIHP